MHKVFISFLFLLIMTFTCFSHADLSTSMSAKSQNEQAIISIKKILLNMQTFQANFLQTLHDKNARKIQTSYGTMIIQKPGKFRWEVKKPAKQIIVSNGLKVWIYDPELEQVIIRNLSKEIGESPAMLLSDPSHILEKDYYVKFYKFTSASKKTTDLQWFSLIPKNPNSLIAEIKIGFLKEEMRELILNNHLGQVNHIEFYNMQQNTHITPSTFTFNPPKGVDVIDESIKN